MFYPISDSNRRANEWQRIMVPTAGKKFIFTVTPAASYSRVGEVYTCSGFPNKASGDISLTRVATGSGTFDRLSAWKCAEWEYLND